MWIKLLTVILGVFMAGAGIAHLLITRKYLAIVPAFLPFRSAIVIVSGLIEGVAGIGLLLPWYRKEAALIVLLLMILFLPLHIWEVFRQRPAIGSHLIACIRLPIQFLLIAWAWYVWRQ